MCDRCMHVCVYDIYLLCSVCSQSVVARHVWYIECVLCAYVCSMYIVYMIGLHSVSGVCMQCVECRYVVCGAYVTYACLCCMYIIIYMLCVCVVVCECTVYGVRWVLVACI